MGSLVQSSTYYDEVNLSSLDNTESMAWIMERNAEIAPLFVGESVLDIGCGLGLITRHTFNRRYLGIDFSRQSIVWAMQNNQNSHAEFRVADAMQLELGEAFDTVLLMEILEHVRQPDKLVDIARRHCSKRLIVTVPVDMPGNAHVHSRWTKRELKELIGLDTVCYQFGGPYEDRWWLAVKDYE